MNDGRRGDLPIVVYVASGRNNEISAFVLQADGRLELIGKTVLAGTVTPLAISPNRKFLYAGLRTVPPATGAFAIDPATGHLTLLGYTPLPDPPMSLATDARGRFLLCASYAGATFTISPIRADGVVDTVPIQHTQTPPRAHDIITDVTNRYLFVTSLGGDAILQYEFDASTGRANPNATPFVRLPRGSGPRHMVFHPRGDVLYVNGELDGGVYAFALDATSGRLSARDGASMLDATSPSPPQGAAQSSPWAAEIAVTPNGRSLYASERRTSTLAIFDVSGEPGSLARGSIIATEEQPRAFAIDPHGNWLIVAGEISNHMTIYRIDSAAGTLTLHQRYAVGEKPVWISIVDLAART